MMENDVRRKLAQEVSSFYESQGAVFSSKRTWPWDLMRLMADRLEPGNLLVDVGAGNGRLADALPQGVRYLGIEPSFALREEATMRFADRVDREVRPGSLSGLDLPDASADAVACIAVLHHIPSREWRLDAVRELHRILKSGGILLVTVWNLRARRFWSWSTFKYAWLRLTGIVGGEAGDMRYAWRAGETPTSRYVHAFTLREFKALFESDKWEIERIGAFDKQGWIHWIKGRNLVALVIKK